MSNSSLSASRVSWSVAVVDQPVLPFAFAVRAHRRVQRDVAAARRRFMSTTSSFGHAQLGGDELDLLGPQVAFLERARSGSSPCAG